MSEESVRSGPEATRWTVGPARFGMVLLIISACSFLILFGRIPPTKPNLLGLPLPIWIWIPIICSQIGSLVLGWRTRSILLGKMVFCASIAALLIFAGMRAG